MKANKDIEGQEVFVKIKQVVRKYLNKPICHLGSILKNAEVNESINALKPLAIGLK